MVASVDCASAMHAGADRPVLLEVGVVTVDAGSIGALLLPDFVGGAVGLDVAVESGRAVVGWVVSAHGFDHIPFDKGVASPAVMGEIGPAVAGNIEGAGVVEEPE